MAQHEAVSWQDVTPFLTALALGLLIGMEREWTNRAAKAAAGSRTFALAALAGALAASLGVGVVVVGLLAVAVVVALGYARTSDTDPGTTTEVATIVTYLLGALAWGRPVAAVALAVVVAVLLQLKERLHHFAREGLTELEVQDALTFFVVAFVVLPLLPDQPMGPYGVLNPRQIWRIVVLLTGIGLVGYVGVRALGARRGLLFTGLAGGFVSSAAVTAAMGVRAKRMVTERPALGAALVASVSALVELVVVLAFVDPQVVAKLWPAVVAAGLVLMGTVALVVRGGHSDGVADEAEDADVDMGRPVALRPALLLTAALTCALLVARWLSEMLGSSGAVVASGVAGLADAHAGALAAATLSVNGDITVETALLAIGASLGMNTALKCGLAFGMGGRSFGWAFTRDLTPTIVAFGAALAAVLVLT